jgi:sec-independent protein translocase protein TatB
MFDIGWSELVLIGVVALIAIGPKELPGALRTAGQFIAKMRRMATEFQDQFKEAMREAEFADIKKEVDEMAAKAQSYARFDPIDDIRRDIEAAASPPPELSSPLSGGTTSGGTTVETTSVETTSAAGGPTAGLDPVPESLPAPPLPAAEAVPAAPPVAPAHAENTAGPDVAKPDAGRAA